MKKYYIVLICFFALILWEFIGNNRDKDIKEVFNPIPEQTQEENIVSFYAAGDNLIHNTIYIEASRRTNGTGFDFMPMYEYVSEDIKNADLSFINQETILGGTQIGLSNYPNFNSPKELGDDLIKLGFDIVNHANNHVCDKGVAGIESMMDYYKNTNLTVTGVYETSNINIIEKNNIKIGILSYTSSTNGIYLPENSRYKVSYIDRDRMKNDAESIRDNVDFIIVSMHWGNEYQMNYSNEQKELAQYLSSLSVDVIIGTHPHVIQPIEYINETLVVYSLGNFTSSQNIKEALVGGTISFKLYKKGTERKIIEPIFTPVITYYEKGYKNTKIIPINKYTNEYEKNHGMGITLEYANSLVNKTIDNTFLNI